MTTVGLVSDTHGLVRPELLAALAGVEVIIHAGDICGPEVLAALARIAPVMAVRGNNDHGAWAEGIPETRIVDVGGVRLFVIHEVKRLSVDPRAEGCAAVIYGHSHRPLVEERNGLLYVNPGSAGPRRFSLPVSCARMDLEGLRVEILPLEVRT